MITSIPISIPTCCVALILYIPYSLIFACLVLLAILEYLVCVAVQLVSIHSKLDYGIFKRLQGTSNDYHHRSLRELEFVKYEYSCRSHLFRLAQQATMTMQAFCGTHVFNFDYCDTIIHVTGTENPRRYLLPSLGFLETPEHVCYHVGLLPYFV